MSIRQRLNDLRIDLENAVAALFPFQRHKPLPAAHKARLIRRAQRRQRCALFLETGTFRGEMIGALKRDFPRLISIELDETLFKLARQRFQNERHITILRGDSGKLLPEVIAPLKEKVFYWLDAHCDGEGSGTARGEQYTPIVNELRVIAARAAATGLAPVIFIDDAHCFNGQNDYPGLEDFLALARSLFPAHRVGNRHDLIQLLP